MMKNVLKMQVSRYARFCARVGRKEAAEEALQHIIWNKAQAAESSITATEDNPEVRARVTIPN